MKTECAVVRDLLPLCAENMVREETNAFVAEHISACEDCRRAYEEIKTAPPVEQMHAEVPLRALRKKLTRARIMTALSAAFIAAALVTAVFAALNAPRYYPYLKENMTLDRRPDGSVVITFGPNVTYSAVSSFTYDENGPKYTIFEVEAGYTLARMPSGDIASSSLYLYPENDLPMVIYYVQNNGRDNVCIYGEENISGGVQTLPRLTLGYYFIIACILSVILALCTFIFRRARRILEKFLLIPVSYLAGHFCIMGLRTISYDITREFLSIVTIAALIYSASLCALWAVRTRKKARENAAQC